MAQFSIDIDDALIPGIVAISFAESTAESPVTPEDVVRITKGQFRHSSMLTARPTSPRRLRESDGGAPCC